MSMSSLLSQCLHRNINSNLNPTRCRHAFKLKLRLSSSTVLFHSSARTLGARHTKLASRSSVAAPPSSGGLKGKGRGKKSAKTQPSWAQRGNQRSRKEALKDRGPSEAQFQFSGQRPGSGSGSRYGYGYDDSTTTPSSDRRGSGGSGWHRDRDYEHEQVQEPKPEREPETPAAKTARLQAIMARKSRVRAEKDPRKQAELLGRMGVDPGEVPARPELREKVGQHSELFRTLNFFAERDRRVAVEAEAGMGRGIGHVREGERERERDGDVYVPPYRRDVEEHAGRDRDRGYRPTEASSSSSSSFGTRAGRYGQSGAGSYGDRDRDRNRGYRSSEASSSSSSSFGVRLGRPRDTRSGPYDDDHSDRFLQREFDRERASAYRLNGNNQNNNDYAAERSYRPGPAASSSSPSSFRAGRSSESWPGSRSWSGSGSGSGSSYSSPDRNRDRERERGPAYRSNNNYTNNNNYENDPSEREGHLLPSEALEQGQDEFFHPSQAVTHVSSTPSSSSRPSPNKNKRATGTGTAADDDIDIPSTFASPPLLPGFLSALKELFGPQVRPTPIQGLSLRWIVGKLGVGAGVGVGVGEGDEGGAGKEWKIREKKQLAKKEEEEKEAGVLSEAEEVLNADFFAEAPAPATAPVPVPTNNWRQFLLASETGSGKSIAYLLPVLQHLKQTEGSPAIASQREKTPAYPPRPRALVLAPTHELARQLAGFAKDLLHLPGTRLRVVCASRANVNMGGGVKGGDGERRGKQMQMRGMERVVFDTDREGAGADAGRSVDDVDMLGGQTTPPPATHTHHVDVVVGTPMKLLEMIRGRGWDRPDSASDSDSDSERPIRVDREREIEEDEADDETRRPKLRRGRDKMPHFGTWRARYGSELRLEDVECVVVDEADVLFDPDFQETTRALLADISAARGHPIPPSPSSPSSSPSSSASSSSPTPTPTPITYPFHLLLTTATIPTTLNAYLSAAHPHLVRLASPRLHRLPKTLQTEYVAWSGGNKFADVLRRVRGVWAEDHARGGYEGEKDSNRNREGGGELSKIVVFCNKSSKVEQLSAYLSEQGVRNVPLTSTSVHRERFTNRHLDGFLRERAGRARPPSSSSHTPSSSSSSPSSPTSSSKEAPKVLITTSLLSRGLDFAPSIRHVFIIDEPRNMVDFLHRAGRAGRAGERGRVVVFGKMKGRGSRRGREVRGRVGRLSG